mmetsp:Transcript_88965/g.236293  ORF Transcript_88965/g.236293 Transcript_88965/m.236293 type:complete len:300 (-) Transcript_88965:30-929(-)
MRLAVHEVAVGLPLLLALLRRLQEHRPRVVVRLVAPPGHFPGRAHDPPIEHPVDEQLVGAVHRVAVDVPVQGLRAPAWVLTRAVVRLAGRVFVERQPTWGGHARGVGLAADDPPSAEGSLLHDRHDLAQPARPQRQHVQRHHEDGGVAPEGSRQGREHAHELRARAGGAGRVLGDARVLHAHGAVAVAPRHPGERERQRPVQSAVEAPAVVEDEVHGQGRTGAGDAGGLEHRLHGLDLLRSEGPDDSKPRWLREGITESHARRQDGRHRQARQGRRSDGCARPHCHQGHWGACGTGNRT